VTGRATGCEKPLPFIYKGSVPELVEEKLRGLETEGRSKWLIKYGYCQNALEAFSVLL